MKEIKRRVLLKLARNIGAGVIISGVRGSVGTITPLLMKYSAVDLDQVDYCALELQDHFQRGNISHVSKEAKRSFQMLEQAGFPANMARPAEIQMRLSMLFARAQECMLPWYERIYPTINTYNRIEATVLSKLPQRSHALYYAQLLAHRAPLYRETGNLRKSLEQFTLALSQCQNCSEHQELLVELYYSRAHIWAILGNEQRWQIDLNHAKECAQKVDHARSSNLFRLITYTEGEGYKRLAYNKYLNQSKERRTQYAAQGIQHFKQAHLEKSQWVGHAILSGVAEAQCLILLEPEQALHRAKNLRDEAQRLYPSIVQKIDSTINAAQRRLL